MHLETATSTADRKLEGLLLLGRSLGLYRVAHARYSALVHDPDSREFASDWEASLYGPVRRIVHELLHRSGRSESSLLYCAPGAHAPLLSCPPEAESLARQLVAVSMADIDPSALINASRAVALAAPHASITAATIDFTGGLGQRLADVFRRALKAADDLSGLETALGSVHQLADCIFDPESVEEANIRVRDSFRATGIESEHQLTISEMVASFTGVPVWMAFRSAVLDAFPSGNRDEAARCLKTAWDLLRHYNYRFLRFHLETLAEQTASGGPIVVVFDVNKRFDDVSSETLFNLPYNLPMESVCPAGMSLEDQHRLVWRDHPNSFPMSIDGFPIVDFCAHSHDIEVLVYRVGGNGDDNGSR